MTPSTFLTPPPLPATSRRLPSRLLPRSSAKLPASANQTKTLLRVRRARRWQPPHRADDALAHVHDALKEWSARTGHPPGTLPSESALRRCDTARALHLHRLIVRAGGRAVVTDRLALRPMRTATARWKDAELARLAALLDDLCAREALPSPHERFPSKRDIQRLDPHLGNRLAQFPGRNGYNALQRYVARSALTSSLVDARARARAYDARYWRVWTDPVKTRAFLSAYQVHPQVLPRLCSLPSVLAGAIQRQGGATMFANRFGMVLHKDWVNVKRFAELVRWLADVSGSQEQCQVYMAIVQREVQVPLSFPSRQVIEAAEMAGEISRYGGRKALSLRLGFERKCGLRDLFMGNFSVTFAADLLEFAVMQVYVAEDGLVAMPTVKSMHANGRDDLADAVQYLGGVVDVGRRLGLVPIDDEARV